MGPSDGHVRTSSGMNQNVALHLNGGEAQPGPGHYEVVEHKQIGPQYKQNKSSMFASGVARAALPAKSRATTAELMNVKSTHSQGLPPRPVTHKVGHDVVLDDSDDDNGPGPGQYYNPEASSFMKSKHG